MADKKVSELTTATTMAVGDKVLFVSTPGGTPAVKIITKENFFNLAAGQIVFPAAQNPSADANTLDDYQEAPWTPELKFGGNAVGMTYSNQYGTYTKIGRLITYDMSIILTAKGSSTGNAVITLPKALSAFTRPVSMMIFYSGGAGLVAGGCCIVRASGTAAQLWLQTTTGLDVMTHANFTDTSTFSISIVGVV